VSSLAPATRPPSYRLSTAAARPDTLDLGILALLTAVAVLLRVSQLHQSLLGDEVFTYQDVVGRSLGAVLSTVHTGGENSPPLFFALAWASAHLGDPSLWIRLPSLLLGSATVPVMYVLGRNVYGRAAGLIAAGIFALAPFSVYYGIEARPYMTMTFFVATSTLALLRAVRGGSAWWWAAYALAAAAAAYSHYSSVFVLGVQALWSLWVCRERIGPALVANAVIVVLYLPWLPHLRGKELAVIGFLYPLEVGRVLGDLLRPLPGHPAAPLRAIPTLAGLIAFGGCVLAGAGALLTHRRRTASTAVRRLKPARVLLALQLLATPLGLLLYSLLVTDLWLPRGLSASLPAFALIIAALVAALPRPAMAAAVLALAIILGAGTLRSFDAAYSRGPFRSVANYLDRVAAPHEPVLIRSYVGRLPIDVQVRKPHRLESSFAATWAAVPPGGLAFVGLDGTLPPYRRLTVPHPPGLRIVSEKLYRSGYFFELVTYRRLGS
jgi:4-amino-4-deoxy-L-arabinose transferase-like glycosyltransferase